MAHVPFARRGGPTGTESTWLTKPQARRIALRAQALDGTPNGVLDAVKRLGFLQLDPTSRVAPSHLLVLWSRLGAFDRAELDRLLWRDRSLFEWKAYIVPTNDFALVKAEMLRFPGDDGAWQRRVGGWLRENEGFRRYVLRELERRGPLRSRDIGDRSVRSWPSGGWTRGRNVAQMIHFLNSRGEVLATRREGGERVWDLPDRVLPAAVLRRPAASGRKIAERRLGCLGLVRSSPRFRGIGESVRVAGVDGEWIADPAALDRANEPLRATMTFLSPFDQLIHDRERAEALFGFRYRIQIYTPKERRTQGFYDLPILFGERLVGRIDLAYDRTGRVLHVNGIRPERGARLPHRSIRRTLRSLGEFLGADRISAGGRSL